MEIQLEHTVCNDLTGIFCVKQKKNVLHLHYIDNLLPIH